MARRGGRKTQIEPAALVAYLDAFSDYRVGGIPSRRRKHINGHPVSDSDARMIRRWRAGTIKGVTAETADALLKRFQLSTTIPYQED